jgi:RNA polymerase sigma-70 factor (ECF subfamily)
MTVHALDENDERLVVRFKQGDEAAFIAIMRRYREMIFNVAMGVLHNRGDAEESTQDAFIRAYRALQMFRGDAALSTWLYRIALNVSRNRYGYFRRRMRHVTSSLDCPSVPERVAPLKEQLVSRDPDPVVELELAELTVQIERGMSLLRPKYREVLLLRNTLHRSYPEIGAIVGINIGTVKSRIARARHSLRDQLTES